MRKIVYLLVVFSMIFVSCKREGNDLESLNALRKDFWNSEQKEGNTKKATELDSAYKAYIDNHPQDTANAEFMFENAKLHLSVLKNPDEAAGILQNLYTKYPQSPRAPEAMYQRGFILENMLQLPDNARTQYQMLIDKYPAHPFAKEAQITIKYVGQNPEQMLKAITDSTNRSKPDTLAGKSR